MSNQNNSQPNSSKILYRNSSTASDNESTLKYLQIQSLPVQNKDTTLQIFQLQNQQEQQTTQAATDLYVLIQLMANSKKVAAICGLLGAFAIHLIVGAIYRWNMITYYVAVQFDNQSYAPIGAPLAMLCAGITMRLGYKLSQSYGSRIVMCSAMVLTVFSTILASTTSTLPIFLFFHNVVYGLCAGLLFLPPITECHRFFPNLKLITNSIILTGTGLGAVLFGAINIQCMECQNSNHQMSSMDLDQLIRQRFESCFLGMSLLVFVIGFIGIALMIPMIRKNEENAVNQDQRLLKSDKAQHHYCQSELQSFKSRVFWMVGLMLFLASCGNYFVISNFKNLMPNQPTTNLFIYWVLISGALGNGLSRVIWGFLFSHIGFKWLFSAAACLNLLAFTTIIFTNNSIVYLIAYTASSISLGGMMVIIPNVVLLIFGKRIGESIYSYYWLVFSLSNFFQFGITLLLSNSTPGSTNYIGVLILFNVCVIGAFLLCCREKLQGSWNNSLDLIDYKRTASRKYSH